MAEGKDRYSAIHSGWIDTDFSRGVVKFFQFDFDLDVILHNELPG